MGEGNKFTLGSIPPINPLTLGDHVQHLMQLCYWYIGVFGYFYRESVPARIGHRFAPAFLDLTPRIERLRNTLNGQLAKFHDEMEREPKHEGIRPAFFDQETEA